MFSQRNCMLRVKFQKDYSGRNMANGFGMKNNGNVETNQEAGKERLGI